MCKTSREDTMRRLLLLAMTIFAVVQSAPSESAQPQPAQQGFEIRKLTGTVPGGGVFTGDILIQSLAPAMSPNQVQVTGMILKGKVKTALATRNSKISPSPLQRLS